jgi:hypothetical protein
MMSSLLNTCCYLHQARIYGCRRQTYPIVTALDEADEEKNPVVGGLRDHVVPAHPKLNWENLLVASDFNPSQDDAQSAIRKQETEEEDMRDIAQMTSLM